MSVILRNVSYTYGKGSSEEKLALRDINLEIRQNEFVAVVGHTGSGKSTLIQLLNGLEKAETITNKLGFIQATSAHNLMLDLLYKTGFLGFIILSIPFFIFLNNLKKINNIKIRYFLEAFCGILLLMSQFEAYNLKFILFIFTILYMYTCENRKSKAGKFD